MPIVHTPLTRRQFGLSLCALPLAIRSEAAEWAASMPWNGPATVARVYLSAPKVHWPKPTLDVAQEVKDVEAHLVEVARQHTRNVKFVGGEILTAADQVKPWLAKMGAIDGVLIIPVAQPTPPLGALVDSLEVPALFFSRPYATHAWSSIGQMSRAGKKIDVIATSSYGDLDPYMEAFRTIHHMRNSKVLVGCENRAARQAGADAYSKHLGIEFRFVSGEELKSAFHSTDVQKAQKEADAFTKGALRVMETTPKEVLDGLRMYQAAFKLMQAERANAFTIDCFGTLAANTLPGYPCISWSKLNDVGLYGVCEADLNSTVTQIMVTGHTTMPGFVSDPVMDISRNEVIHAHCVAATRMKGIHGPASPYILRNHLETNEGTVVQVLMPAGETITVGRFNGPGKFLISTAEVTGTVDSDRGCRSQIRTRVSDAEKWLRNFSGGLHRVIFYGDHVKTIERMGRLTGFEVVHEI